MPFQFKPNYWLIAITTVAIAFSTIAWQNSSPMSGHGNHPLYQDTVPSSGHGQNEFRHDEFRDEQQIEKAMQKLGEALKRIDTSIDNIAWQKIQDQVQMSMERVDKEMSKSHFDIDKMQREINNAMKNLDLEKIKKETALIKQEVQENILNDKINEEVQHALSSAKEQLTSEELHKNLTAVEKMTMDQVNRELQIAKEEFEHNKVDLKKEMDEAKVGIEKANGELRAYRKLLANLEKDGLIKPNEDYSIEFKGGELYINGQKQPPEVLNKYKDYFKKDNTKIYKNNGRFNIDTE
jgi:hypothetical protein